MQINKMAIVRNSIKLSSGGGTEITVVANYSALPDPTIVSGQFYWAESSQGTSWLPGGLGGTYYNSGMYYSNGTIWQFMNVPYQATQDEVDAGINTDKFITPKTFNDSAQLASKEPTITAGTVYQYWRGDKTWQTLPSNASGGSAISYYLNGGTAASVATYYQMSKTAVIGTGVDFSKAGNGLISQWLTDVADPNRLEIPAGAWNFEMYMSASNNTGTPAFYVELLKYDGVTFTTIANSSVVPEVITSGTLIDLYLTSLAIPQTTLLVTDRLAIRVYIVNSTGGRTITMHTQDSHLCEIITNFAGGIAALNGLVANTQNFAVGTSGTDFAISSSTDTHTFNLPSASAANRGALLSADWTIFNNKLNSASPTYTGLLSGTGTTQTGSLAVGVIDLAQIWNTTGTPIAFKINITDTASNGSSLFAAFQIAGSNRLTISKDGYISFGTSSGSPTLYPVNPANGQGLVGGGALNIAHFLTTTVGYGIYLGRVTGSRTPTTGENGHLRINETFAPTSGTATYNSEIITTTINQTGGANGITRGLYVIPTLTAAFDFRAIESVNGKVIFTDTFSAGSGALAGSLLDLAQTWNTTGAPTSLKLNVTNTASGANALLMDLQVGGVSQFKISKAGVVTTTQVAATTLSSIGSISYNGSVYNITSGVVNLFTSNKPFSPTSGTGESNAIVYNATINQTGGANGITRAIYIAPTLTSAFDFRAIEIAEGKLVYSSTIIASGTTGAQTINKISGKVNAAAATTSLVVTNSLVTASSIVMCQLGTNDATCVIKSIVEGAGSFTINYTAPTSETVIKFTVIN